MGEGPLDPFVRDLKQNKKDQADLKDDDVMEVRKGDIFGLTVWSTRNAIER